LSLKGSALFGINEETGNLYWDGKLIQTSNRLGNFERGLGIVLTTAIVVMAILDAAGFFFGR
jgi:hypothetical protein